jgi:hypothetical protein
MAVARAISLFSTTNGFNLLSFGNVSSAFQSSELFRRSVLKANSDELAETVSHLASFLSEFSKYFKKSLLDLTEFAGASSVVLKTEGFSLSSFRSTGAFSLSSHSALISALGVDEYSPILLEPETPAVRGAAESSAGLPIWLYLTAAAGLLFLLGCGLIDCIIRRGGWKADDDEESQRFSTNLRWRQRAISISANIRLGAAMAGRTQKLFGIQNVNCSSRMTKRWALSDCHFRASIRSQPTGSPPSA